MRAALAQYSKGRRNMTILSEGMIPVQIDGQSAYEICLSYTSTDGNILRAFFLWSTEKHNFNSTLAA